MGSRTIGDDGFESLHTHELNLSPTCGDRVTRVFTLMMRDPSGLMLRMTVSTMLVSLLSSTDLSRFIVFRVPRMTASADVVDTVLPMTASPVCKTDPTGMTPVALSLS